MILICTCQNCLCNSIYPCCTAGVTRIMEYGHWLRRDRIKSCDGWTGKPQLFTTATDTTSESTNWKPITWMP